MRTGLNEDWFASDKGDAQIAGLPRRRLVDLSALDDILLFFGSTPRDRSRVRRSPSTTGNRSSRDALAHRPRFAHEQRLRRQSGDDGRV